MASEPVAALCERGAYPGAPGEGDQYAGGADHAGGADTITASA
jgi:hypothetical protein